MIFKGFKLPMSFFLVWSDEESMIVGKVDPNTKEVIEIYEIE